MHLTSVRELTFASRASGPWAFWTLIPSRWILPLRRAAWISLRYTSCAVSPPVLPTEFVVPSLQVLDCVPQALVSAHALRSNVYRLIRSGHPAQLRHGSAGGQVVVYAGLVVTVRHWQVDHEHNSAQLLQHCHEAPLRLVHVGVGLCVRVVDDYHPASPYPNVIPTCERYPALAPRFREVPDADDPYGRLAAACESVYFLRTLSNPEITVAAFDLFEHQRVYVEGDPAPDRCLVL